MTLYFLAAASKRPRQPALILVALILLLIAIAGVFAPTRAAAEDLFIVTYEANAKAAVANEVQSLGGAIRHEFDNINVLAITLDSALAEDLAAHPNVVAVEVDPIYHLFDQTVPYGIDMVQARDTWDANRDGAVDAGAPTGEGIRVCIVDTGIYAAHEDLGGGGVNIVAGQSWVNEDWSEDRQGHGTHVAGTVAAMNNGTGVVGVSPGQVDLIIADVFNDAGDGQASSTILAAANWCAGQGAHVISMSLGGSLGGLDAGYQALYDQGILVVAAAGNDGGPVQSYPASYPSVISVAAVDSTGTVADFSNFPLTGEVELAAPGVAVLSAYPFANSVAVSGGPTYVANPVVNADPTGIHSGPTADGGDCNLPPAPGAYSGKVVLCQRGGLPFRVKIDNAASGGASAVILYNNEPGNFSGTYGDPCCAPVPAVSLSQADGEDLLNTWLGQNVAITINLESTKGYAELSGTSMATPHASAVAAVLWSACPDLTNDQIRSHLDSFTVEPDADLVAGRDAFYGYGIVRLKDAVDALSDGIDDYDPNNPNLDGGNPANVECGSIPEPTPPTGGGQLTGSGWLQNNEGAKINFFAKVREQNGSPSGELRLRDDTAGAAIEATNVTAAGNVRQPCGSVGTGPNAVEFWAEGTYNGTAAAFRVCVEDSAGPGNSSSSPDLFYLACLSGCSYNTGARTPDGGLDGGNVKVHEAPSSDGQVGGAAGDSSASVLGLDPLLLSEAEIGALQVLEVAAYDAGGALMSGVEVTLEQTTADGTSETFTTLTGVDGLALFTVTVLSGDVEYIAYDGSLSSNAILITGLASALP